MFKFKKTIKFEILYGLFLITFFYFLIIPLSCLCYEHSQTITITKDDILNAKPNSPYPVNFSQKDLKRINMLEKRHFNKTFEDLSDEKRLKNLEYELLEQVWEFTPQENRIKTLEIASTNRILQGTSLPAKLNSKQIAKRLKNDSVQLRKTNDVGLIDGFLRLISPEKFEEFRQYKDYMFKTYDY